MRALLVYPEYPDTFWSFKHALRFVSKAAAYPPLGLLTVGAMLPTDWEPRLVDLNVAPLRDEDLLWADVVLISAMSIQAKSVRAVIEQCKSFGRPIVAGGPLFTTTPDDFPDVDHLVLNEAELTFPRFLHDFSRGRAEHLYASTECADLSATPPPRWELITPGKYASMSIQLSRGCPFDCEFCNVTSLFGRKPRTKDEGQIVAELDHLYQFGWRGSVFFVDDNFVGSKERVKHGILPAVIEWMRRRGEPFCFNTQVSLNLADDPELLRLMSQAGFVSVFIGIESVDEDSLEECNKIPNKGRNLLASVRTIQRAGLQVQGGFIVGFDHDSITVFDRMTEFIQRSGIVTAMVGLLNAPRGTRLYQRLEAEGRLLREMTGDNTDCSQNFVPRMNPAALLRGYQRVVQSIYSPAAYYQRVKTFLREFRPARRTLVWTLKPADLLLGARFFFVLGVFQKERTYLWRLLFWSLFKKPRLLPMALTFTAYGFHFRKCAERHQFAVAGDV